VVQQRRATAPATGQPAEPAGHEQRIAALEERIECLEALVEGLQDSVHREAVRRARDLEEVGKKIQPAEMARELGRHAREHGI
jgi:hypothetical protein